LAASFLDVYEIAGYQLVHRQAASLIPAGEYTPVKIMSDRDLFSPSFKIALLTTFEETPCDCRDVLYREALLIEPVAAQRMGMFPFFYSQPHEERRPTSVDIFVLSSSTWMD
jgi:hypothetical protein